MKFKFDKLTEIKDTKTFQDVRKYLDELISFATANGYLADQHADNKFIREIGRIGLMVADYESFHVDLYPLTTKNPLIISIENEMKKKALNQRQTAELLEVKENTLSQILTGKRNVSMRIAKRLHQVFNIDANMILEFS